MVNKVQTKKGALRPPSEFVLQIDLVDRALDGVEQVREAVAQSGGGSDDADGDERGNQAVLDGSRTGLVVHETSDSGHLLAPCTRHF